MKQKICMLFVAIIASTSLVSAQDFDPKYGADPADRPDNIKMINYMEDAYKMKLFDEAMTYIRQLIVKCPKATVNLYIRGSEIYRNKLLRATNKADRMKYLDSMMIIYDQRNEAFGENPKQGTSYIKQQKAKTFFDFAPAETERATQYFRDAIAAAGKDVDPDVIVAFFNMLTESFKIDAITLEAYMNDYQMLTDLLNQEPSDKTENAMSSIEGMFVVSGAANCDNIEKLFKPKYEATPDDPELIKKILGLFERSKCQGPFQFTLLEKYYEIDPKPIYAAMLASAYEEQKNYTKALEYIEVAIANEKDDKMKANHMLRAAISYLGMSNYRMAADLSRKVIAIDESNAMAHMFLANAMASGVSQSCSDFERNAAYWLVVDAYRNALKYFSNDPAQTDIINKQIYACTANFPKGEDILMLGLEIGSGYTVNCGWISGRTTVRSR